jgi:hypothetical protein
MAKQSESHAHDTHQKRSKLGTCNEAWLSKVKAMHVISLEIDVNWEDACDSLEKRCKLGTYNEAWLSKVRAMHMISLEIDVNWEAAIWHG